MSSFPELPPPTDRLADLTESEQLVLSCFRRVLAGPEHRDALNRGLSHQFGPPGARAALQGLEATIRVLTAHASRNIAYHRPCCPCVGADEIAFLTVVTAVQRDHLELAHLVARNFVPEPRVPLVLGAAAMFANALLRAGLELPLRFAYCAEPPPDALEIEQLGPQHTLH